MKVESIILLSMLVGGLQSKPFYGLAQQVTYFNTLKDVSNKKLMSSGVVDRLEKDQVVTIVDFEKSVKKWLEGIERIHPQDQYTCWIRLLGYIKGFLIILCEYGDQFRNKEEIVFNTPIFEWQNYKNFPTQDSDALRQLAFKLIVNIQKIYNLSFCI